MPKCSLLLTQGGVQMLNRVGQQLGNYRLIRLLGEGGSAQVYLGEHIHLDTQAAIKVLHARLAEDAMDMFRTEARTLAHLVHPSIVRILDFGVADKIRFLVMDFAPNGTLGHRHPRGRPVPPATVTLYVKQIAAALQYAHDKKLIHRDIKPMNLLLGSDNRVLLSDFGLVLSACSSRSQSIEQIVGTITYMAPEQIEGKPCLASDQYSLGIVVYEWLSGDCPFHGSFSEIASQHLSTSPPSLRESIPTISPFVEQVVMRALAKNPKERFSSVQAFAAALEEASQPTLAPSVIPSHVAVRQRQPLQCENETPFPKKTVLAEGRFPLRVDFQQAGPPAQEQPRVHEANSKNSHSQLLTHLIPVTTNARYYARRLHRRWLLRRWLLT
jgi:serine/threonine protein kinase